MKADNPVPAAVDIIPTTADAVPAMCPIGSMANDVSVGPTSDVLQIMATMNANHTQTLGRPSVARHTTSCPSDRVTVAIKRADADSCRASPGPSSASPRTAQSPSPWRRPRRTRRTGRRVRRSHRGSAARLPRKLKNAPNVKQRASVLPSVIGELHTARNATTVGLNASGRRRSTGSVSPNRYDHTIAPMAISAGAGHREPPPTEADEPLTDRRCDHRRDEEHRHDDRHHARHPVPRVQVAGDRHPQHAGSGPARAPTRTGT